MTNPVYEPNLERTDAALSYGSQQLFRRPAPVTAPIYPWVRRNRTYAVADLTVPSGVNTSIVANAIDGSTDPVYTDYFAAFGTPTGYATKLLFDGVYSVHAAYVWDENFAADCWLVLNDGWEFGDAFYWKQNTGQGYEMCFNWRHRWSANETIGVTVSQLSGSDKHLLYGYTEIAYLGSFTGTPPVDADPQM